MKVINVDNLPEPVVHALEAIVATFRAQGPDAQEPVDPERVKAAILARRDASRATNRDWEDVDREVWDAPPEARE
jgi:hypothetical protein